jgi:hypothetical protein
MGTDVEASAAGDGAPTLRVFVSYRRDDSAGFAGRLTDAIEQRLGRGSVFRDVDDIRPGEDFVAAIEGAIGQCDVLLVVIGRQWLTATDAGGRRRLDDPHDFVRLEVGEALQRNLRVIPVLVAAAPMPAPDALPEEIAALGRRQAIELRDSRWEADLEALLDAMEAMSGTNAPPALQKRPTVEGLWSNDEGMRWLFVPGASGYGVEVYREDGGGLWARGNASASAAGVRIYLDLARSDAFRYLLELHFDDSAEVLAGTSTELVTGTARPISLRRIAGPT